MESLLSTLHWLREDISDLQLTVASTRDKVIMIEAGANEVPEDQMIEAIYKAHEVNQEIIRIHRYRSSLSAGKRNTAMKSCAVPEELFDSHQGDRSSGRDGSSCILLMTSRQEKNNIA